MDNHLSKGAQYYTLTHEYVVSNFIYDSNISPPQEASGRQVRPYRTANVLNTQYMNCAALHFRGRSRIEWDGMWRWDLVSTPP